MSKGIEAIPGGLTDQVAKAGGADLRDQLDALLGYQPADVVMFALVDVFGRFLIGISETEGEAETAIDVIAADLRNFVALNHAEGRRQIAARAVHVRPLDRRRQ